MEYLTTIANGIISLVGLVTDNAEVIAAFLVVSGGVTLLLEPIKRWFNMQSRVFINAVQFCMALIPFGVSYLQGTHSNSPSIIAIQSLIALGTNQFLYPLITKPIANIFVDAKAQANASKAVTETKQIVNEWRE